MILIIGETCNDVFIYGTVNRISPEAPIPIIEPKYTIHNQGMAANVANNIISLGTTVTLVTNSETISKTRYVDDSYNYILLRVDDTDEISILDLSTLPTQNFDAVIISDYNKGFLTPYHIQQICEKYKCPIFLDTKKNLGEWVNQISYIKINHSEYEKNKEYLSKNRDVLSKTIITKGKYGCEFDGISYPTKEVEVKDVVGAGDTFLAGLVFKFIETNSIEKAIEFANKCSTNVVQKRGVAVINPNELENE